MTNQEKLEAAGWTVQVSQPMDHEDFDVWFVSREVDGDTHTSYLRSDDDASVAALAAEPTFAEPMTRMPEGWVLTVDLPQDVQAELDAVPTGPPTTMGRVDG
jgi:hypothetical protein